MRRACAAAASAVLLLACCASAPLPRIYVLESARPVPTDMSPGRDGDRIQVAPIAIPDYLDSTDLLMRQGAHELVASSTGRWGDRLSLGLREALASDLRARLPRDFITTTRDLDPLARQLLLTVSALDVWQGGRCILTASWSISGKRGGTPILVEDTFMIQSGAGAGSGQSGAGAGSGQSGTGAGSGGDSIVVASMATAVAMLADRIAASVAAADQPTTARITSAAP